MKILHNISYSDLMEAIKRYDPEPLEIVGGTILDNELWILNKCKVIAVYEKHVNCWTSDLDLYVADTDDDNDTIISDFYKFMDKTEEINHFYSLYNTCIQQITNL